MNANISIFSLLSSIFLNPPEIKFLKGLKDKNIFGNWPIYSMEKSLNTILKALGEDLEKLDTYYLKDLRTDYFELFVGTQKILAPPYESVYLGKEGIIFDSGTLKVRNFYHKYGLTVDEQNRVPDDHLGYQLYFISELLGLSLNFYKKGEFENSYSIKEDLYNFIKHHTIKWIDLFCSRVEKHSDTFFYRGISGLTGLTLIHLYKYLGKTDRK